MSVGLPSVSPMDETLHIDCSSCVARSEANCADCVVTCLLGAPPGGFELDIVEVKAFDALAQGGLVPPLRHQTG